MTSRRGLIDSRFRVPTLLLGIGLGGSFDGIVLHQVLQWHHVLSSPYPPDTVANLELNTLADGVFHIATWVITIFAVLAFWMTVRESGGRPSWRVLIGGVLAGWGAFNVVEGIVDHLILGIHHVRSGPDQLLWDMGFLAWGAAMLVAGVSILRRSQDA
jgi:uncharacterized membrane protein